MNEIIKLCIGDIVIELAVGPTVDHIRLQETYLRFLTDQVSDSRFVVHCEAESIRRSDVCRFDTNLGWQVLDRGNHLIIHVDASEVGSEALVITDQHFRKGDIFFPEGESRLGHFPRPLSRQILIGLLSQGLGVILHASGVSVGGQGFLFAGTDGVGKTTTAKLWATHANGTIIGDDQIIVREREGKMWMYSTPWHGVNCTMDVVPVSRIFIIRQGKANQLSPVVSPARATAQLLKRSFPPLWSAEGMAFTLDFLSQLCVSVPVHDFAFVPDRSAVEMIQCLDDV